MTHGHHEAGGAAIGGALGMVKALVLDSALSWQAVYETAVLAAVGAVVGYLTTSLLKFLKSKFKK